MSEDLNFDPNEDDEDYNPENFRAVVERMFENMHGVARIERTGVVFGKLLPALISTGSYVIIGNRTRLSEFRQRSSSGTQQRPRRQRVRRARHNTEPTSRNSDDSGNSKIHSLSIVYLSATCIVYSRKSNRELNAAFRQRDIQLRLGNSGEAQISISIRGCVRKKNALSGERGHYITCYALRDARFDSLSWPRCSNQRSLSFHKSLTRRCSKGKTIIIPTRNSEFRVTQN